MSHVTWVIKYESYNSEFHDDRFFKSWLRRKSFNFQSNEPSNERYDWTKYSISVIVSPVGLLTRGVHAVQKYMQGSHHHGYH